ncbi:MAG: M3 family metallopeptidase, partial [Lysinibacillus sp.]
MTTFKDYEYKRPNMEALKEQLRAVIVEFNHAKTVEEQNASIEKLNKLNRDYSTMVNLVYVRASIDTADAFYQAERDYFDEVGPEIEEISAEYNQALMASPFREQLEGKWGNQLFDLAANQIKSFSPSIMDLMQKENKLTSEYSKLVASAQIEFNGETLTLAQLGPYAESTEREMRKAATNARVGFYEEHESEFDRLYDELVKIRHEMAVKLGYKNYVELGYILMNRIDYDATMVGNFRDQVRDYIVPLATKLFERQAKRIGITDLKYYDESLNFLSGNATPKGDPEWIVANGKKMYEELSSETGEFFNFMIDQELMDLVAKKGKESGGYCTFIENYEAPFI